MNPHDVRELLDRAAAGVTPADADPVPQVMRLSRRAAMRRRAVWAVGGSAAAATVLAGGITLPTLLTGQDGSDPAAVAAAQGPAVAATKRPVVSLGGVSVTVPDGWRTARVKTFDACDAKPRTVYLASGFDPDGWVGFKRGQEPKGPPPPAGTKAPPCASEGGSWMAVVEDGLGRHVVPTELVVQKDTLLEADSPARRIPSMRSYRAFDDQIQATTVFIAGSTAERGRLLERVTWPAAPPAPASGGLALPDKLTSAMTDLPPDNHMTVTQDAAALTRIRTALAGLRQPVPADKACSIGTGDAVGIALSGEKTEVTVVLGDEACPQAISNGGGRVEVPAGLGRELRALIKEKALG